MVYLNYQCFVLVHKNGRYRTAVVMVIDKVKNV